MAERISRRLKANVSESDEFRPRLYRLFELDDTENFKSLKSENLGLLIIDQFRRQYIELIKSRMPNVPSKEDLESTYTEYVKDKNEDELGV